MKLPTKHDIVAGLNALGIKSGDRIIVHSSFKSLGPIDGGIKALLQALMDVITPDGTIMMPVFNKPLEEWTAEKVENYTGAVPAMFCHQRDAVRSEHPTHSVAVWGKGAASYAAGHLDAGALSVGSPMHKLALHGCKVVNIGTTFTTVSLIHVAESIAKSPYCGIPYPGYDVTHHIRRDDGSVVEFREKEFPGCSRGFDVVLEMMRKKKQTVEGSLLQSHVIIADGSHILAATLEILKKNPGGILCDKPDCKACAPRKQLLAERK